MPDYSKIDVPEVLSYVFYPRDESGPCPKYAFDHFIPVAETVALHCRFYEQDKNDSRPWILYFHGNGEVVSDYDEIALFYLNTTSTWWWPITAATASPMAPRPLPTCPGIPGRSTNP
jgi:hypothetical protein